MPAQRRLSWTNALRGMHADRAVTAEQRHAAIVTASAIRLATESAKRFARTTDLVRRDGTFDRSTIMQAAIRCARVRMEVTGEAWSVCMSTSLTGAWAAAKSSRHYRAH